MMFHSPWFFLLLPLIPLFAWRLFERRNSNAIRFTSIDIAKRMTPTLRQRLLWVPKTLSLLAILFLILGLAQPREGLDRTVIDSEGIAIEMVVDRSGSMQAMDFKIAGQAVDRLTAIKSVATRFIRGETSDDATENKSKPTGRFSDLIGLITFAGYADGVTPATLDHSFVIQNLNETEIVEIQDEDGTAIGDAIALATQKLTALDERQETPIKSKVVILLTDGENTAGDLEPVAAAELAQTLGIKVYTIGVGTRGRAPFPVFDPFTRQMVTRSMRVNIDENTLKQVADITGGQYFRATDTESLISIYKSIDELEKTKVEAQNYVDYRELAVQPYRAGLFTVPPMLLIAFGLLVLRVILENTWLRGAA